jgi:hypothetical protein
MFAGSSNGLASEVSFLIGDYVPGRQAENGTFMAFDQVASSGDTYVSSAPGRQHGYVALTDDVTPQQNGFLYPGYNINVLLKSLPVGGRFIYSADQNPLARQLQDYTRPLTPATFLVLNNALLDVTQDGTISAADALMIVNDLNSFGSRRVVVQPDAGEGEGAMPAANSVLDVNGDSFVSAADVLTVINAINAARSGAAQSGGEGEAAGDYGLGDDLLSVLAEEWTAAARRRKAS